MQLDEANIKNLKRQIKIQGSIEILAVLLLGVIVLGFFGAAEQSIIQSVILVLSIFLCIGLLSSRPSQELKSLLQAVISSDANNIKSAVKSRQI